MSKLTERSLTPSSLAAALCRGWTWRMAWRDSRSQRVRFLLCVLSIAAGVCALVSIHALKTTVREGLDSQAKALLGADLLVSSRSPITAAPLDEAAGWIAASGAETAFSSMLGTISGSSTQLVQVRAVAGGYPFYTTVETEPPGMWGELQQRGGLLVEPAVLEALGVKVGDTLKLGALELPVIGTVKKGIPRSNRFSGFAPEVFLRAADLPGTGLASGRSLVFHHQSIALKSGSPSEKAAWIAAIRKLYPEAGVEFQTAENRREAIGERLDQIQEFLGISALMALVLGGVGVAGAMHAHVTRRLPTIAILLCLGCPTYSAVSIFFAQAILLGIAGSALGAIAGVLLHAGVIALFGSLLPVEVQMLPHFLATLTTGAVGFMFCCGFALVPLLSVRDVPPNAILSRRENQSVKRDRVRFLFYSALSALVCAVARLNGASLKRAVFLTAGIGVTLAVLAGVANGFKHITRRIVRPSWPYLLRQGVSNIFRPRNQTLLFLLSLGLCVFLMLVTWGTRTLLIRQLRIDASAPGPNLYLVDVQPDQISAVTKLLEEMDLPLLDSAPMVTMRIASVKGRPLEAIEINKSATDAVSSPQASQKVPRWVMEREYRSTYRAHLNPTETLVAGVWPPVRGESEPAAYMSLEQQLARDLKVVVGDELVLDVQGVLVTARVTSLRKVDWSKFNLNFFMVFAPGPLDLAPQSQLMATKIPPHRTSGELQRALLKRAPNVSVVDLTSILATVAGLLEKAARIVQMLSLFTMAAALPVLLGAMLNGSEQRVRESVLLRTIGASERQLQIILAVEYTTLGVLSAASAAVLAVGAHWALARYVFHSSPAFDPDVLLGAFVASVCLSVLSGLLISRGICRQSPMLLLRENG